MVNRLLILVLVVSLGAAPQSLEEGVELYGKGKYKDAERVLQEVVASDPTAKACEYLALTRIQLDQLDAAAEALRQAEQLEPESASVPIAWTRLHLKAGRLSEAEQALAKAARLNPDDVEVELYRGAIKVARRNYKDAAQDLERVIKKAPHLAYAHYFAGLAYNGLRKTDLVVERFQAFLSLAPGAPEAAKVQSLLRSLQ